MLTSRNNLRCWITRTTPIVVGGFLAVASANPGAGLDSTSAQSNPESARGRRMQLAPCEAFPQIKDAQCGTLEVFEDRTAGSGRKIALKVVVLPALSARAAPDPVFFLAGGPGQGIIAGIRAGAWRGLVEGIRRERDVILVDQRGTGESNPLDCDLGEKEDMQIFFSGPIESDRLGKCRADLEKGANLTLYTTPIAMDDLDDVRAGLGYERINLIGGSYGTTAAFVYLRQHPDRVRAAVLTGVAPPDYRIPLPFAKSIQHALDLLMEDCALDDGCKKDFPNLRSDFAAVLSKLDKGPVHFEGTNPVTKKVQPITLSRGAFVNGVRVMLYATETARLLPMLIHQASRGEYDPFARTVFFFGRTLGGSIARGMHLSVCCSEDVPFIRPQDIERETAGTYLGDYSVRAYMRACESWPHAQVPRSFTDPVKSDTPVLMISGELDPVSPPWLAEGAARYLPNSRHAIFRYAGHTSESDCSDGLMVEFIRKGSAQGLDTSCVERVARPPFLTEAMMIAAQQAASSRQTENKSAVKRDAWESWNGTLDVGAAKLRLVLRLSKTSDGAFTSRMDSLDQQGAMDLPIDTLTIKDGSIHFEMKLIGAFYDGKLSGDGSEMAGQWNQGNRSWPLTFKRASLLPVTPPPPERKSPQ